MSKPNDSHPTDPRRRRFFGIAGETLGAVALIGALPQLARADDLPHLTTSDPTAQALGYSEDSSKVDAAKYATHKADQACAGCNFYHGAATGFGPCDLFPGKAVNAKGWCSGFAKKA